MKSCVNKILFEMFGGEAGGRGCYAEFRFFCEIIYFSCFVCCGYRGLFVRFFLSGRFVCEVFFSGFSV